MNMIPTQKTTGMRACCSCSVSRGILILFLSSFLACHGPVRSFQPPAVVAHRRRHYSFVTALFAAVDGEEQQDQLKWERMYIEGGRSALQPPPPAFAQEEERAIMTRTSATSPCQVRVVSFDLDNTLWKTSATIDAANDALAAFLDQHDIQQPKRVERVMGDLFKRDKEVYCPIEKQDGKSPVLLTLLRKDAIRKILIDSNDFTDEDANEFADKAFAAWTKARHDAIPNFLASSTETCLEAIASIETSCGHPVLIGAITDGNSDPSLVDSLEPFFDFCVNAEQVGVSKPDKRVYLQAVSEVIPRPCLQSVVAVNPEAANSPTEDLIGPWWIHIGDDFVKDVVAAKQLGMRTVWCRELVMDKVLEKQQLQQQQQQQSRNEGAESRTVGDLVKEVSERKTLRMQVGAEDYLVDSFEKEFTDAIVDSFSDLASLLHGWHNDALRIEDGNGEAVADDLKEEFKEEEKVAVASQPAPEEVAATAETNKFCLFCGTKLPPVAKFCSACGEKQTM